MRGDILVEATSMTETETWNGSESGRKSETWSSCCENENESESETQSDFYHHVSEAQEPAILDPLRFSSSVLLPR